MFKKILRLYIYMNININTFNIFKIYAVCVFLYVYNKYTQYTHTHIM